MTSFLPESGFHSNSIITDGKFSIFYEQLLYHVGLVEKEFESQGIAPSHGVALFCSQTTACALVLLTLLTRNQSVVLLPERAELITIPQFCKYKVRPKATGIPPELSRVFLEIDRNPRWEDTHSGLEVGKVFIRTSGSTGSAKMVVHDCNRLRENARNVVNRLGIHASDRIILPVPLQHMYGLGAGFLTGLLAGASIELIDGVNLLHYLDREQEFRSNVAFLTPAFALSVAKTRRSPRLYRMTVVAGDRLPLDTFTMYSEYSGCIVQVYGSTEMGAITATCPNDSVKIRSTSSGLPLPGVRLRIEKSTGHLLCRHEYGFEGYSDDAGKTMHSDDYFLTRDIAEFDERGNVKILGRSGHLIKRDGFWVSIGDIEAALFKNPVVLNAVVVAAGEGVRGTGIVAYCVLRDSTMISSESTLRQYCLGILPRQSVPDSIRIVSSLPELGNGKLDRQSLVQMALRQINLAFPPEQRLANRDS